MTGYVYFIQAFSGGPIKIGYSENPKARLASIQTSHYERLDLVGVVRAERRLEQRLHEDLSEWRLSGEWFEDSGPVCLVIEALTAPAPGGDVLHARIQEIVAAYAAQLDEQAAA